LATIAAGEDRASEKRMTFFEHLEELRQRLKVVILVVIVLFVLNLTTAIGSVTLGSTQVPMLVPALGTNNPNIATQFFVGLENYLVPERVNGIPVNRSFSPPWDAYVVMFKVAFFLAAITASPVIAYEMGQFIGPALKASEKRLILRITAPVVILFLSGVTLCLIVVLPFTFQLLYSVQTVLGANFLVLNGDDFASFVLLFSIGFGLAFQLPVLMYGLSWLGVVSSSFWKKYWRIATIAIFFFGAIITPDGSGVTMMLVSLPMLGLYVIGYVVSVRVEKRRTSTKTS
jgi:sec-independent protein translocase protein TatC